MFRALCISASILLLAGPATAAPSDDRAQIQQAEEFQALMDLAMAEMMKPGPKQDGWDKGGVDPYQAIESAPGGASKNWLLTIDKDGERSILIARAGGLEAYLPKSWKPLVHGGDSERPASSDDVTFAAVDGSFHFAGWDSRRKVNDAFCSGGKLGAKLYAGPAGKAGELPPGLVPVVFNAMVKRLQQSTMCWRYDRDGDGYRVTYFLEDGRSLPELTAFGERLTIVPASTVEQHLAGTAAAK